MTLDQPPVAPSDTRRTLTRSLWEPDEAVPLAEASIDALLRSRAEAHPERLALVATGHDGRPVRLTYGELLDEARTVAAGLRRVAAPGDAVALWAPNVAEWPVIEYAAALAGVVLVALNPVLTAPELEYALGLAGASVLLHADVSREYDMAAVATSVGAALPDLRHVISLSDVDRLRAAPGSPADDHPTAPDDPAMLQFTSGTTGRPKAVLLEHRSLVDNARLTMITAEAPAGGVGVVPLPMFHTAACVISTLGPAWLGGTQVLLERFVPDDALATLTAEGADVLFSVPTVLGAVLEAARRAGSAPTLSTVLVGAATVPGSMIEAVRERFGASVHNLYGQTELSPVLSLTRRGDTREDLVTTVGRPLPHTGAAILDPATGDVVPVGVEGEICARGYNRMVRYHGDDAATASTIDAAGWLHTGDLGTMDDRGLLTVTGRLKDLIIRGGENIAPAEIEVALAAHDEVLEVAVVGLPDEHWGEIVAAAVVVRDRDRPGLLDDLAEHARGRLAAYKRPARWFVLDELPTTPSGKVQKFVLRDRLTG